MDTPKYYMADIGGIKLLNKNGCSIHLHNGYGDGTFKFYVFNDLKELYAHVNKRYVVTDLGIFLEGKDWFVLAYDCSQDIDTNDTPLKEKTMVYQKDQTFFFVTNDTVIDLIRQ